ncbi:MAG: DNA-processing protein DprA, partial [Patescibacteria group bacterium]
EWETQEGTNWTFPVRDRIIAALADEIIVTEAAVKSGALITVRDAVKLKRKIWAVPGPITSKTSEGTNNLIFSKQAEMWLGQTSQQALTFDNPVLALLQNESLSTDEIARKLNRSVSDLGSELSILLLSGKIVERSGKYYLGE